MAWAVLNNAVTGVFCVAHSVHSLERQNNKTWNWMRHPGFQIFAQILCAGFSKCSKCVCVYVLNDRDSLIEFS